MAKTKEGHKFEEELTDGNDFSADLIEAINKEFGCKIAYNLSNDVSPTHVKRWISTGSLLLDYAISNRRPGGIPEGRIIEIFGAPSTGKSHIAYQLARTVQGMGGLVVYVDSENSISVDKLGDMGIDTSHNFVYLDVHMTEDVFTIMEKTILKAKNVLHKNIPILIVWDSVAATSPKAELEAGYEENSMGLQARVLSKGFRKITGVIGQNNITLVCLNQTRQKLNVLYGDNTTTPGGMALLFHSSVRLHINGGSPVKDKDNNVIGIGVSVNVKKNKVAQPHRKVEFDILFGRGIYEEESMFDMLRAACENEPMEIDGKLMSVSGTGAWKVLTVKEKGTNVVLIEKKFTKTQFKDLFNEDEYRTVLYSMLDKMLIVDTGSQPVGKEANNA